jgi:hypothetical protein
MRQPPKLFFVKEAALELLITDLELTDIAHSTFFDHLFSTSHLVEQSIDSVIGASSRPPPPATPDYAPSRAAGRGANPLVYPAVEVGEVSQTCGVLALPNALINSPREHSREGAPCFYIFLFDY